MSSKQNKSNKATTQSQPSRTQKSRAQKQVKNSRLPFNKTGTTLKQSPKGSATLERKIVETSVERRILGPRRGMQTANKHYKQSKPYSPYLKFSKAIALPGMSSAPKWTSEYEDTPTATVSLKSIMPVPQNTTDNTADFFDSANYSVGIIQRFLECGAIVYNAKKTATTCSYTFYGAHQVSTVTLNPPSTSWVVVSADLEGGLNDLPIAPVYALPTTTYQPHGPMWFGGGLVNADVSGDRFYWFDQDMKIDIGYSSTYAPANLVGLSVAMDMWTKGGVQPDVVTANSATASGTLTLNINESGYYCLKLLLDISAQSSVAFSVTSMTYSSQSADVPAIFGHQAVPGYVANFGSVNSYRVTGLALMYSNTSANINLQGSIAGYQIPLGEHWSALIDQNPYTALTNKGPKMKKMNASTGMYAFVKPASSEDWEYRSYTLWRNGILYDSYWPIDDKDTSKLILVSNIVDFAGRSAEYTLYYNIEYQTTDQWKNPQFAPLDGGIANEALKHVRGLPQYAENPLHIAKIWDAIKSAAKAVVNGIVKYGPKAVELAGTAASMM